MHCRKICKHRYYEKQIIVELKIYIFLVSSTYLSFLSIFFIKGRFFIFLISIRGFCSMYIYLTPLKTYHQFIWLFTGPCEEFTLIEVNIQVVSCECMNDATCILIHDIPKCICKPGKK